MLEMKVGLVLVVAACGSAPRQRPVPPPPPPPPVIIDGSPHASLTCVTPPEDGTPITRATGDSNGVRFCLGTTDDQCFALRLEGLVLDHAPPPPPVASDVPRAVVTAGKVEICLEGYCRPLPIPGEVTRAAVEASGDHAVVLLGDGKTRHGHAEIWEVARGRRVASFAYGHGDYQCGDVAVLGATVYINAAVCGVPSARGALYTLAGKPLGDVGGKEFGTYGGEAVELEGALWAFLEESGNRIVVEDVAKAKVTRRLDVSALWRSGDGKGKGPAIGSPGESALVRLDAGKLAVIAGSPNLGGLALVDVGGGPPKIVEVPRCEQP
jgi:hypothetical protein